MVPHWSEALQIPNVFSPESGPETVQPCNFTAELAEWTLQVASETMEKALLLWLLPCLRDGHAAAASCMKLAARELARLGRAEF